MNTFARILAAVGVIFLAGCLKLDEALTLRPDGSGVVEVKYSMSEESIIQFRAMMLLKDQLMSVQGGNGVSFEQTEMNRVFLSGSEEQVRTELRRYDKFGVKVDTLKIQSVDGWRQTHLVLLFDSLAKLGGRVTTAIRPLITWKPERCNRPRRVTQL